MKHLIIGFYMLFIGQFYYSHLKAMENKSKEQVASFLLKCANDKNLTIDKHFLKTFPHLNELFSNMNHEEEGEPLEFQESSQVIESLVKLVSVIKKGKKANGNALITSLEVYKNLSRVDDTALLIEILIFADKYKNETIKIAAAQTLGALIHSAAQSELVVKTFERFFDKIPDRLIAFIAQYTPYVPSIFGKEHPERFPVSQFDKNKNFCFDNNNCLLVHSFNKVYVIDINNKKLENHVTLKTSQRGGSLAFISSYDRSYIGVIEKNSGFLGSTTTFNKKYDSPLKVYDTGASLQTISTEGELVQGWANQIEHAKETYTVNFKPTWMQVVPANNSLWLANDQGMISLLNMESGVLKTLIEEKHLRKPLLAIQFATACNVRAYPSSNFSEVKIYDNQTNKNISTFSHPELKDICYSEEQFLLTNLETKALLARDVRSNKVINKISMSNQPKALDVSPQGQYVAVEDFERVKVWDWRWPSHQLNNILLWKDLVNLSCYTALKKERRKTETEAFYYPMNPTISQLIKAHEVAIEK